MNDTSFPQDTVLIVDDDRTIRTMLSYRLRSGGINVEQAEDGTAALVVLRELPVDIVLLDMIMPGLSGLAVLVQIKADPALASIPVIMMSVVGDIDNVVRCLHAKAEDYLPKPLDAHLLLARVNGILMRKRIAQLTDVAAQIGVGAVDRDRLLAIARQSDVVGQLAQEFSRIAALVGADGEGE